MLKEELGRIVAVWKNREVKAVKPEKLISVESQPKLMPITVIDRVILTDTREI